MMENIEQVRTLIRRVDKEIIDREPRRTNFKILRSLYLLRIIKERLARIESLLRNDKYDLVFIGEVGVGKTTTICHILNLTRSAKRTISRSSNSENRTRTIQYTKELLSTGSGRTTICEVVICPADTTFIEVVPAPLKRAQEFLDEFCEIIWQKVYPNNSARLEPLSAEVSRAVRNMVGLQEVTRDGDLTDTAREFANQFEPDEYEKFRQAVLVRGALGERKETILRYTPSEDSSLGDEKRWIEENFGNLNLVNQPDFPLPGQIKVHVSPRVLDFNQLPFLKSVVDTRGLDVVKDRSDIEAYVRENDEAICIFTDTFLTAPNRVVESLTRYLTKESRDIDTKLSLLVLPRKGEPERVLGSSGTVQNRQEGINRRLSEIQAVFAGQNIKFIDSNILFYDPLQHYTSDQRLDPDCDPAWVEEDRNQLYEEFASLVERRKRKLLLEARSLENKFWKIVDGNDLSPQDERIIESLKKILIRLREMTTLNVSISSGLVSFLDSVYASQLNAINRRFGEYDEMNIYFKAKTIAEDCSRRNFGEPKSKIDGAIRMAKEQASELSGLQPIMDLLEEKIDQIYEQSVISLGEQVARLLRSDKLAPQDLDNPFWYGVRTRWGAGEGFVRDVLGRYEGRMRGTNRYFENETMRIWEEDFMQVLCTFFGDQEES